MDSGGTMDTSRGGYIHHFDLAWATPPQALHTGTGIGHDILLSHATVPNTGKLFRRPLV